MRLERNVLLIRVAGQHERVRTKTLEKLFSIHSAADYTVCMKDWIARLPEKLAESR